MRFDQASEVLEYVRAFCRLATDSCRSRVRAGRGGGLDVLIDVLAQRDERIERLEQICRGATAAEFLDSWFAIADEDGAFEAIEPLPGPAGIAPLELTRKALSIGDCLCSLYRHLSEEAETEALRELSENLLEQEQDGQRLLDDHLKGQMAKSA